MVSLYNKFCVKWKVLYRFSSYFQALTGSLSVRSYVSTEDSQEGETDKLDHYKHETLPDQPTNCCMSGCPNCVWIEYAEQLKRHYIDSHTRVREAIEKEVQDPNLKAFLLLELKFKDR